MNDYWNDPLEYDDGIRECARCHEEVEFSEEFRSMPVLGWEEITPNDISILEYDGIWPPIGTRYICVQHRTEFEYVCPHCGHAWIVED